MLGNILLKLNGMMDPLNTPLRDTLDLVRRLQLVTGGGGDPELRATTIDFESLYTNFIWSDVNNALGFWLQRLNQLPLATLGQLEQEFVHWMQQPITRDSLAPDLASAVHHCFINSTGTSTIAGVLLDFVFHNSAFRCPGVGVLRQRWGWSMGTNCAPTWANLSLRMYEILRAKPNDLGIRLFGRFIDDCIIVHTGREDHLLTWMTSIYPAHLPILPQQTAQEAGVVFLDLHILGLCPLAHAVYWKPTHSSNYIP